MANSRRERISPKQFNSGAFGFIERWRCREDRSLGVFWLPDG